MKIRKQFDFVGSKKIFFAISIALIAVIIACSFIFGVKMDIQFKGGTIVEYTYQGEIDQAKIKKVAEDAIGMKVSVNMKGALQGDPVFDIVLTESKSLPTDTLNNLIKTVQENFKSNNVKLLSNSSVNPTLGAEFFGKSLVGVAFAALLIVIYVALRFKKISGWSAGVMAVVALLHDVIVVFGVFVLFRIPLDYNFIAVLLTILGYSVNDTIVIYDRIRENDKLYGKAIAREELVNRSVNETLTRTINTSITTLMSMIVISIVALVMGVDTILSFSFPMAIGLISGTYSTVFIASPLWVMWQNHKDKVKAKKKPVKKAK